MPGAMKEILFEALRTNVLTRRVVHLEAPQFSLIADGILHARDSAVARIANHSEHTLHFRGRLGTAKSYPRDVVVDRLGTIQLSPHVHEYDVTAPNLSRRLLLRLVVRIRGVRIHRNIRPVIRNQSFLGESSQDELLHLPFGDAFARPQLGSHAIEGLPADGVDLARGFE